ncbi:MAG TPA: hypothetical protein VE978_17545 [Chitinophagales bacterium]|nr:hypothetical protein [Chitinophagales bacterium]
MKKNFACLILFGLFIQPLRAQYTPFFKEEFDDNKNNWFVGDVKKSSVELNSSKYSIYNDEGKNPIVSLIDLPFDEHKNYRIESNMEEGYIPYEESRCGIMFAAKDEKNGYGVFFNRYKWFYFVKIEGGKIKQLFFDVNHKNSMSVKITLEDWRWKFVVGDTTIYTCDPLPFMGHKAGFYSDQASIYANDFTIEEATPSNACPAPFIQQKFSEQLEKILCSAPRGFNELISGKATPVGGDSVWLDPSANIDGSTSHSIVKTKGSVRQYIISFNCPDSMNFDNAERLFDEVKDAINNSQFSCKKLKQDDVKENVSEKVQMDAQWFSTDKSDQYSLIELALHNSLKYYEVLIHVYADQ